MSEAGVPAPAAATAPERRHNAVLSTVPHACLDRQRDPAPAALRRLTPVERRRILARIDDLDQLAVLVRERPYIGRWAA